MGIGWVSLFVSNQLFWVVFPIHALNGHYGLTAGSVKINIRVNRTSRTRDKGWVGGVGTVARGLTWVSGTVHLYQLRGTPIPCMAPRQFAKPWTIQKGLRHQHTSLGNFSPSRNMALLHLLSAQAAQPHRLGSFTNSPVQKLLIYVG